jgi:hypothetical protein
MPALNNLRYEAVAQARAKGVSQREAAEAGGLSLASANRVCRRPEVLLRIKELNPNAGLNESIRWEGQLKPIRKFRRRKTGPKPVITLNELIVDLMQLSREARAAGDTRIALMTLKEANKLRLERDASTPVPGGKTKSQRAQDSVRDLNEEDPADEYVPDNGRTPSLSEIDSALGEFDDNPRNPAQAEQGGPAAVGDSSELHETDGDK